MKALDGPEIRKFVKEHLHDDIHELALKYSNIGGVPVGEVIDQIASRNKARSKLPSWFDEDGLIFPPPISIEQASSEITGAFKSTLLQGEKALDLTGGSGVDTYYFSKCFRKVIFVEREEKLVKLASHNFKVLDRYNIECICNTAEKYLQNCAEDFDLIYLDPSRRRENKKVFELKDSSPDVSKILEVLLEKGRQVLIKTSPLLDIKKSLNDLKSVVRVFVVSVKNETREVLYLLDRKSNVKDPEINTINIITGKSDQYQQTFMFHLSEEHIARPEFLNPSLTHFIYEPNSSILKAGAFKTITQRFGLYKFHPNTHLYSSQSHIEQFPGKIFQVMDIFESLSQAKRKLIGSRMNITVRNYPVGASELARRIKCIDGGENYLIAARISSGEGRLFLCRRVD